MGVGGGVGEDLSLTCISSQIDPPKLYFSTLFITLQQKVHSRRWRSPWVKTKHTAGLHNTEPLFKTMKILPLTYLNEFFRLQCMQRFMQGFLPCSFNNTWISNEARRQENTPMVLRNHDDFYLPSSRLKSLESFPLYSFPRAWINLPDENIKFTRNIVEFNLSLKTHLLNKLSSTVACTKAYCPSCNPILQIRI